MMLLCDTTNCGNKLVGSTSTEQHFNNHDMVVRDPWLSEITPYLLYTVVMKQNDGD